MSARGSRYLSTEGGVLASYRRFELRRTGGDRVATLGVARNETLYECLERHGFPIRTTCRGSAICGLCWVRVESDRDTLPPPRADEAEMLELRAPGTPEARLACRLELPESLDVMSVSTVYWDPPAT